MKGYVFLPAAGMVEDNEGEMLLGESGLYWTRTEEPASIYDTDYYYMEFDQLWADVLNSTYPLGIKITTRLVHK